MTTPEQKRAEEEYRAARRRYEDAYVRKQNYEKKKATEESRKQKLISIINEKKSELKQVTETRDDLLKLNGKDGEVNEHVKKTDKDLSAAAVQFKNIGTSSLGEQKDLEVVFAEKITASKKYISDAFAGIEKAKKDLQNRIDKLNAEIS